MDGYNTVDELKAFIGCHIIMGIHELPNLKAYWSSGPLLRVETVADTMTANRLSVQRIKLSVNIRDV